MHPSFEQFVSALRDPAQRVSIGLSISDADAAALLTSQEWATDYYHQWLAMFPAAGQTATHAPDFGPPPQAFAPQNAAPFSMSTTQLGSASRVPSGLKRLLIIGGSALGAVLLIVIGVSVYSGVVANSAAHHPVAGSTTPASAAPLPADLHGLSAREYPLLEAVFESEDRTIPGMAAQGMTDDRLRTLTDTLVTQAQKACDVAAHQQNGFDNPTYKSSFIAGYVATAKVTPEKAGIVYDAIVDYCAAG
jgi:hypothetical protein